MNKDFDFLNKIPIICLAIKEWPNKPIDQSPPFAKCICVNCEEAIWVSRKMREFEELNPGQCFKLCLHCAALLSFTQVISKNMDVHVHRLDKPSENVQ